MPTTGWPPREIGDLYVNDAGAVALVTANGPIMTVSGSSPDALVATMKHLHIPTWVARSDAPDDATDTAEYYIQLPDGVIWWKVNGHYVVVNRPQGLNFDDALGAFIT